MAEIAEADLSAGRVADIRLRRPDWEPELITGVVRAVLSTMNNDLSAHERSLLAEVEALGRTIACAKAEIAGLRIDDIKDSQLPFATDELDAIVGHTAAATDTILNSCETLDEVAANLSGEAAARLQTAATQIYEACGFQDLTGQRITKVVATLKTIEAKIAQILHTFGTGEPEPVIEAAMEREEAALLKRPQNTAAAMDQSDIDRLLAIRE
jgi:chemotaxis protein CheZ